MAPSPRHSRMTPLGAAIARVPIGARIAVAAFLVVALGVGTGVGIAAFSAPKRRPPVERPSAVATPPVASEATPSLTPTPSPEPTPTPAPRTEMIGFYVNWDDESYRSLQAHIDDITVLMPMWYHVGDDGRITVDDPEAQAKALALVREKRPDLKVMPLVNNYDQGEQKWNAPEVAKLLARPEDRRRIANDIVTTLDAAGFDGVNIDFEDFKETSRADLVAFMAELYPLARAKGLEVSMDVLVGSKAYDHAALARNCDYLIPMLYGEHWRTSGPGPIASQGWFERTLGQFLAQVPADKVVVGIGVYGRNWGSAGKHRSLVWADALREARAAKVPIRLDAGSLNPTYRYKEGADVREAWFLDSAAVFNQVAAAARLRPRGYAIWRMGAEDPATWNALRSRDALDAKVAESLGGAGRTVVYDPGRGLIVSSTVAP